MNRRALKPLPCLLLLALTATVAPAQQETQQLTVPVSDPGAPLTLHASLLSGGLSIEGYGGSDVVIDVVPGEAEDHGGHSKGMRRIPNTSLGLTVEEQDNEVSISGNWASRISQLRIKVPRRTSLQLSCINNGDIAVDGVEGELELRNTNGEITATNVSGSVVAHTTNGEVRVTFDSIEQGKAMSFITFNGDVDVTFPPGLKASLRLNAGQGDIYTDFDFEVVPQKPVIDDKSEGGRFRIDMNREVHAEIGGGGPEMHFKTWNGDIFIRSK